MEANHVVGESEARAILPAALSGGDREDTGGGVVEADRAAGAQSHGDVVAGERIDEGAGLTRDIDRAIVFDPGSGEGAAEVERAGAVHRGGTGVVLIPHEDDHTRCSVERCGILHRHRCADDEARRGLGVDIRQHVGVAVGAQEECAATRPEAVGVGQTGPEGGRIVGAVGSDAVGHGTEEPHPVTQRAHVEGLSVDGAEGEDARGGIATAEEVVGGTVLDPAETVGTETNRVEAEIGGEAENARPARVAADMDVLTGLEVARAVDLEGGERADPDVAFAELGGVAEGDLVAEDAAEVVAAATGEEGAALITAGNTVVRVDVEGAAVAAAVEGAVAGDETVEDEALAAVDLKHQVAHEIGGSIDLDRVVVAEDEVGISRAERATHLEVVDLHGLEAVIGDDPISLDTGEAGGDELAVVHGEHRTDTQVRVRVGGDELGVVGAVAIGEKTETAGVARAARIDLDRGTNPEGVGVTRSGAGFHHPSVNLP